MPDRSQNNSPINPGHWRNVMGAWSDWRERRNATKIMKAEQKADRLEAKADSKGWDTGHEDEIVEEEVTVVATNPKTGLQQESRVKMKGKRGNVNSAAMLKKQQAANEALQTQVNSLESELDELQEAFAAMQEEAAKSDDSGTFISSTVLAGVKGLVGVVNAGDEVQNVAALQLANGLDAYCDANRDEMATSRYNWMQMGVTILTAWAYYDVRTGLTSILSADSGKKTKRGGLLSTVVTGSSETAPALSL